MKANSEVLDHKKVSVENVKFIVVSNSKIKKIIEDQLLQYKMKIEIKVNQNYYFTKSSLILN